MAGALSDLRWAVERARKALPAPDFSLPVEAARLRQRLNDRLTRDLLPRLSGELPALIAGIAGPNNVGKSSLFNALAKERLSPARAEGGLTKQCLAAAHPSLWESLRPVLEARYDVEQIPLGALPPVDQPGPPGRLFLALTPDFPPGLLLIDTPDFDSVYLRNRANAEALLLTVDLVIFVVSRHSYQNLALLTFLKEVVGKGRPYAVVYNEAPSRETARAHLDKVASDVGCAPVARYLAAHQPAVEEDRAFLRIEPLENDPELESLLRDPDSATRLKLRAMKAALSDAGVELRALAEALDARARPAVRLRDRIRHELRAVGERAALRGVPADVLVAAFRDELDARSAVHRLIRTPFRALATVLTQAGRGVRRLWSGLDDSQKQSVSPISNGSEDDHLKDGLRRAIEALAPELPAWMSSGGEPRVARALERTLGPETLAGLETAGALSTPTNFTDDREALYQFCRERVAQELDGGFREGAMQAMTTLVYSVPAGAAAATTVATGGLGHDAVIWGGTLLSTPLLEKFVDLLGAGLRERVSRRWAEAHGASLARALEERFFAEVMTQLDPIADGGAAQAEALRTAAGGLE